MSDALPPVDSNVTVPASVKAASEAAEAAHKAAYQPPNSDPPAPVETQPVATADLPVETPPVADPPLSTPDQRAGVDPTSWEGKYYAMEGRYRQTQRELGSVQEQASQLGNDLQRTQDLLRPRQQEQFTPPQAPQPQSYLTEEDVKTYGPELLDVVKRAAREAVEPAIHTVQTQTRQVNQRVVQSAQAVARQRLQDALPDWKEIRDNPEFKEWLRQPDIYSRALRGNLLRDAYQAADAPRVIAFYEGFVRERAATGRTEPPLAAAPVPTAPVRQAAVPLEQLAAPGRPRPATGNAPAVPESKPVITRAQIAAFYSNVRAGRYTGRDADKQRDEFAIFAAQNEGRVR